jgi:putative nucleotidyltransferase with HDIG domain
LKDLRSVVQEISELPTLPQVVGSIIDLIDNPDTTIEDVNKAIEKDPALVGRILRLVNSAYYGLAEKVNSVRQAIVILGFSTVKSLAISASVFDMFNSDHDSGFSRVEFWNHSMSCATISRIVARWENGVDEDTAFVVGLLHDIGKLVLHQHAPEEFNTIIREARRGKLSFSQAENVVLGETDHAEIGSWVAERWQLSDELIQAIANHHTVLQVEDPEIRHLAAVCRFANYICHRRRLGSSGNFCEPVMDEEIWALLSIKPADMPKLVEAVNKEFASSDPLLVSAS